MRTAVLCIDPQILRLVSGLIRALDADIVCDVFSEMTDYLKSPHSYDLLVVDSSLFGFDDVRSILRRSAWIYLAESDYVALDILNYRPIAGFHISSLPKQGVYLQQLLYEFSTDLSAG